MTPSDLYERLLDASLEVAWRQWTAVGVAGTRASGRVIVDPEALLLATLEIGRSDARLFDEALDWTMSNASLLDVSRLRRLGRAAMPSQRRLLGAVAKLAGLHGAGPTLRRLPEEEFIARETPSEYGAEPLFRTTPGSEAGWHELDETFADAGYLRAPIELRGMSARPDAKRPTAVRFRMRALVGIGPRAEVLTYLLTHEWAHGRLIAERAAYGQAPVAEYLAALAEGGLAERRVDGRRTLYRLSGALRGLGDSDVAYVDWTRAWPALIGLLEALRPSGLSEDAAWMRVYETLAANEVGLRSEGLEVDTADVRGWARQGIQVLERAVEAVIERVASLGAA